MTTQHPLPPAGTDRTPGLETAALVFAILVPPVGLVLALVALSSTRSQGRPRSGTLTGALIVSVVLTGIGLLLAVVFILLAILGFGIFAWALQTISPGPTLPPAAANELVLTVSPDTASPLSDDNIASTMRLVEARLDRAGIDHGELYLAAGTLRVTLPDSAEPAEVVRAGDAVAGDYLVEVRTVFDAAACPSPAPVSDPETSGDPTSTLVLCDDDGVEQLTLAPAEITGNWISDAYASELTGAGGTAGAWVVTIIFTADGTAAFEDLTSRLVGSGPTMGRFAIVIDGAILTAPVVNAVISDGQAQIAGAFDEVSAQRLAAALRLASAGLSVRVDSLTLID